MDRIVMQSSGLQQVAWSRNHGLVTTHPESAKSYSKSNIFISYFGASVFSAAIAFNCSSQHQDDDCYFMQSTKRSICGV